MDRVQLPTDQLEDKICRFNLHSCQQSGGLSLNRHNSSPINTSPIAVTHYNIQCASILHKQLPTTNNKASTLPKSDGRIESLWNLLQRLTDESLLPKSDGRIDTQLPLLNFICSYFENFSQSTAYIATRFGECSLTSLDKLWYTYSYIYKLTTKIIQY